jgi:hypothetical protein
MPNPCYQFLELNAHHPAPFNPLHRLLLHLI